MIESKENILKLSQLKNGTIEKLYFTSKTID